MGKRNIEDLLPSPRIIICTLHVLHSSREVFCHSIQMIASAMRRSLSDTERLEACCRCRSWSIPLHPRIRYYCALGARGKQKLRLPNTLPVGQSIDRLGCQLMNIDRIATRHIRRHAGHSGPIRLTLPLVRSFVLGDCIHLALHINKQVVRCLLRRQSAGFVMLALALAEKGIYTLKWADASPSSRHVRRTQHR